MEYTASCGHLEFGHKLCHCRVTRSVESTYDVQVYNMFFRRVALPVPMNMRDELIWTMAPIPAKSTLTSASGGDEDTGRPGGGNGAGTGVITSTRPKTQKPSMYKVLLLNDDYTPMEFVVHVLERFFNKSADDAMQIMLHVHRRGVGICGVYPYEIAESKVTQVMDFARKHQHPLQCILEKD